ncbi:MAG: MBL fold metallo-hydrolase [Deltaproteobacteria bacterium]|nr:MBL fold metallo-hydrolase [Deltaproteobacteria bacterium]
MTTTDRVQFVGHASLWITLDNRHFLVDTVFSERILGIFKRHSPIGIDLHNLPDVAALLVTHAHYDHLDIFSYKYFPQDKKIVSPDGLGAFIGRFLHNPLIELNKWQTMECSGVKITGVPAKHFGFRFSGLRYTKCLGFVLEGSKKTVYVAGDTGYGPHFREIGEKFNIDIACLPIGSYRPAWSMKSRHLNPEEALRAFNDLKAKKMIPIHWGGFRLAMDKVNEPIEWLKKLITGKPVADSAAILQPGESIIL